MARVRELARDLGLSAATVSRALHHDPRLSAATIERVLSLAATQGFPQLRNPSSGSGARLVLVLIRDQRGALSRHHQGALDGLRRAARKANVALAVHHHLHTDASCVTTDPAVQVVLHDKRLAGAVIIGGCAIAVAARLSQRVPLVSLGHDLPLLVVDAVQADHQRSAETLVEHLADLGHQRIGLLCGDTFDAPTRDRVSGYRSALSRLHGDGQPEVILRHDYAGPQVAHLDHLIRLVRSGVTGWLIGGHDSVTGVVQFLQERGLSVPADVSVVGFHQTGLLADGRRATTCTIPALRLGQELLASLTDRWQGRSGGRRLLITCPLVRGATAAHPPKTA